MKGAIGNAFILNLVITFMLIFFSLLIGSMAYSKAYKAKNYLINLIDKYKTAGKNDFYDSDSQNGKEWDAEVNEYFGKIGYIISDKEKGCPYKDNSTDGRRSYYIIRNTNYGYDYCIYIKRDNLVNNPLMTSKYNYMVLVYMKFDLPVIGDYIKIPITGETKSYTVLR